MEAVERGDTDSSRTAEMQDEEQGIAFKLSAWEAVVIVGLKTLMDQLLILGGKIDDLVLPLEADIRSTWRSAWEAKPCADLCFSVAALGGAFVRKQKGLVTMEQEVLIAVVVFTTDRSNEQHDEDVTMTDAPPIESAEGGIVFINRYSGGTESLTRRFNELTIDNSEGMKSLIRRVKQLSIAPHQPCSHENAQVGEPSEDVKMANSDW